MRFVVLFMLVFACVGKAETAASDAQLHLAAHLGVSYALDTMLVGFNNKALRMDNAPVTSEIFAAFTTLFIGAVYEAQENASGHDMIRATWQNSLGIGAAVLTRMMFTYKF